MPPIQHDISQWLEENQKFFVPPICNKLMYKDGQLKTFFVGGPNSRKDFHMEAGEEFFYMLVGDMSLVVHERGQFRNIVIKEGEVFLLPPRIPHSPQRASDTIGMVIEREREKQELDCMRYYVDDSDEILYEKWFYCSNLEDFAAVIKEYFASEAYRTGKPIPGSISKDKPLQQDIQRNLGNPFSLRDWLERNNDIIDKEKKKSLFKGEFVSRINILGSGRHDPENDFPETFLWQIRGRSTITVEGKEYELLENQTMLIPKGEQYTISNSIGGRILSVVTNPE